MNKSIIIATGGTGGHVFPALSLAKFFQKNKLNVDLISDNRGLKFIKDFELKKVNVISSSTIFVKNPFLLIKNIFVILFAIIKSIACLKQKKPNLVFGVGGYSSFPVCLAAKILKIPFVIYENNLLLGKANKYLLPFASKIFTSYGEVEGIKPKFKDKIFVCGNIIREEINNYQHKFNDNKELKLLVLGGSQAAGTFGEKLPKIFVNLKENSVNIKIFQQCLKNQSENLKQIYAQSKIENEIFNFESDILRYYKKVDLVISRAGSSVSAELISCNIPFVSIPLPKSADGHQLKNAKFFEKKGLCFFLEERDINNDLFSLIKSIYMDKSLLLNCIKKQKIFTLKNENNKILENILNIIHEKN